MRKIIGILLFALLLPCVAAAKTSVPAPGDSAKAVYAYLEAVRLKNMGRRAEAFDLLRHAIALDSTLAAAHSEAASYYFMLRDAQSGYRSLLRAVEYDPDNYWYSLAAAECAIQVRDYPRAEELYAKMLQKKPSDIDLLLRYGETCLMKGEPQKALDAYTRFEEQYGAGETTTLQKVRIYHLTQDRERSYEEVRRLMALYPRNAAYRVLLGDLYLDAERYDDAREAYGLAMDIDPDYTALRLSLLNYYRACNDLDNYRAQADTLFFISDIDTETLISVATDAVYVLARDTAALDDILARLCDRYPNEADLRNIYAEMLIRWGRPDKAREQVETLLDIAPEENNWNLLFSLLFAANDNDAIVAAARRAVSENPKEGRYYLIAASALSLQGDSDGAEKLLGEGLAVPEIAGDPLMRSEFLALLADIAYRRADLDGAFRLYEEALKYNPQNYGALNNYSYYLALLGRDLDKAERMSGETIKAHPDNPTYLDTYGWIYFRQGRYALARIYLKKALDLSLEASAELYEHYGDVQAVTGNDAEALVWWEKALEAGGGSELLLRKISEKKYIEK